MQQYNDNPAGRLHALLTRLRELPNLAQMNGQQAWGRILAIDPPELVPMMQAMTDVIALPNDIERELRALSHVDTELFLAWRPKVDKALARSTLMGSQPSTEILAEYDDATLAQLAFCSFELHRHRAEKTLDPEERSDLAESIEDLRADVMAAEDLTPDVRAYLLEHLSKMEAALKAYDVRGLGALGDALDSTLGEFVRRPEVSGGLQSASVRPKFEKLLVTIGLIVTTTTSVLQLPAAVHEAFDGKPPTVIVNVLPEHSDPAEPASH